MPPEQTRQLTFPEALFPIVALIVLIGMSFFLFGDAGAKGPNQIALVIATLVAVAVARLAGHSLESLRNAAIASVSSAMGAIFILLAVGSLIGSWAMSGTLEAMVYYGLKLLEPGHFYVTTAAITAILSACIGSSWTVVGTIGIGLMGVSLSMGLDPAITAGAIISGAYFGDTSSPLSDSANLAAATAGTDLYTHIRETGLISAVALLIALAVFWSMGQPAAYDVNSAATVLGDVFQVSPLLFLPLLVVVALALLRWPPFLTIFIGALAGALLAVLVAPERVIAFAGAPADLPPLLALLKGAWLALANGYVSTTGHPQLDALATRGGAESMLGTVWLIITALAFGGVIEKAGVLERLMAPVIAAAKSTGTLALALVGAVVGTNIAAADQYIAIVLPGRMFKGAFSARRLEPVVLSRTIGSAGTPTSALIPWNSCGAYMAATLGVATLSYLPFAIFSLASPLLVIAAAYAGFRTPTVPEGAPQPSPRPASADTAP